MIRCSLLVTLKDPPSSKKKVKFRRENENWGVSCLVCKMELILASGKTWASWHRFRQTGKGRAAILGPGTF